MNKFFSACCMALFLTLLPMEAVLACKCTSGETKRNKFDKADYVALVKITATELRETSELDKETAEASGLENVPEYVRVSFDELEVFKGEKLSPRYLIEWPFTDGNCMIGLRPGLKYVIFLSKESHGFVFGCSGSFPSRNSYGDSEVAPEIKELREWSDKSK